MSLFEMANYRVYTYIKTLNSTTGKYETTQTIRNIRATIQPLDPEMVDILPEGDRTKKAILIATSSAVVDNEVIVYKSDNYRIVKVDDFSDFGLVTKARYQLIGVRDENV